MNRDLTRRRLLTNTLLAASGSALGSLATSRAYAAPADYKGELLVTLQLDGGVDVTAWCDPKVNTPGEPKINHWADEGVPQKARGIYYAPFADNDRFFKKYAKDMLVVNGVDAQTNAHGVGIMFNWSGR
ncbi:MAG: ribulose phosphate epimerase, partial [Halieaceae bacterium]|nr:ribulose phosphate epimerase [Halieaceae bacterium]